MIELDQAGASAASAFRGSIPRDLRSAVSSITVHHGGTKDWKIVADDAPHLIFSKTGGSCRLTLVGARTCAVVANLKERQTTAVVRLRPGSTHPLFGVSGSEIVDRGVPLGDALGYSWWRSQLEAAAEQGDRDLTDELLGLIRRIRGGDVRPVDWAVSAVVSGRGRADSPREISNRTGLSPRTLRRRVREATGLSPSRLLRIRRLHRALLDHLTGTLWSRAAVRAGYTDQSHLIRDCRDLLGETPTEFARRRDH